MLFKSRKRYDIELKAFMREAGGEVGKLRRDLDECSELLKQYTCSHVFMYYESDNLLLMSDNLSFKRVCEHCNKEEFLDEERFYQEIIVDSNARAAKAEKRLQKIFKKDI